MIDQKTTTKNQALKGRNFLVGFISINATLSGAKDCRLGHKRNYKKAKPTTIKVRGYGFVPVLRYIRRLR